MNRMDAAKLIVDASHICMRAEEWVPVELAIQLLGRIEDNDIKEAAREFSRHAKQEEKEKGVPLDELTLPWIQQPSNVKTAENQMIWATEVFCNSLLSMEQYEALNHVVMGLFENDEYYKRIALSLRENEDISDYLDWIMLHVLLASDLSKNGKVRNGGYEIGKFVVKLEDLK